LTLPQAVPLIEHLPEYKALDDEGRRVAFAKFVKRQKVCAVTLDLPAVEQA
jgi:pre-mRNA-processing factor 40